MTNHGIQIVLPSLEVNLIYRYSSSNHLSKKKKDIHQAINIPQHLFLINSIIVHIVTIIETTWPI
jgi:hypothetical protein